MGCTESAPVANSTFEEFHTPLGASVAANRKGPLSVVKEQLVVREIFFSLIGDSGFAIKDIDGRPYGGLHVQATSRDELILRDARQRPVLVCRRAFNLKKQRFTIFTTSPNYPGQGPSKQQQVGHESFYKYAIVERSSSKSQTVWIETAGGCQVLYTIHKRVAWCLPNGKKRVIQRFGQDVAFMEQAATNPKWNSSYILSVAPGVDVCLMICLCSICDDMDKGK